MNEKTFNSLLKRYEQSKEDRERVKKLFIEGIGEEFTFTKTSKDLKRRTLRIVAPLVSDGEDMDTKGIILKILNSENLGSILKELGTLIYDCCVEFKDPKLHEACGVKYPYDIIGEILDDVEVINIGCELMIFILSGDIDFEKKSSEDLKKIEN